MDQLRTMSEEEEGEEQVWRAKLLRCQRQVKSKEEELSRQSQYFQNFKIQLQRKLSMSRDREQSLLSRIYSLEKQLLDMTVSAATGMATMKAARITAGTVTYLEEQERGEGEGEEEKKEERKRQWWPSVGNESKVEEEETDVEGSRNIGTNGARLQSFIISLQEDLRVLLEREELSMTEQRSLTEQLQEAQEKSSVLGCRGEEVQAEVQQLKLSESCLLEEVKDLREENQKLQKILKETRSSVSSMESSSAGNTGKVQLSSNDGVVPVVDHQATAENTQTTVGPTTKNKLVFSSSSNNNLTTLPFTTEIVDEFKLGTLSMEESLCEESEALLQAYRSLGLEDDVQTLQENTHHNASLCQDDASSVQDDLIHALNQENRALADRIQELLDHIELKEEESLKEQTHLREDIKRLQEDEVRLEQANQEHVSLISELTKKTEDDLNSIMELQQKLEETKDLQYLLDRKESCNVHDNKVERQLTGTIKKASILTSGSEPDSPNSDLEGKSSNTLHLNSPFNQETFTTNFIQSLRTQEEEEELNTSKEQEREVSQSVRLQTEEKRQLTREIWGLKEEKDCISKSLADLKLEKEKISRTLCGLRDERNQFTKSMSSLRVEKEHLTKTLSALERDKDAIKKSLSAETVKRDQVIKSMQSLQTERDELNQLVLHLKEERDKLSEYLKCLKDQETMSVILKEDHLIDSVSRWREGKEQRELIANKKESLQSVAFPIQSEESSERAVRSPTLYANAYPKQEESDLRRVNEALKEEIIMLQERLNQNHLENKQLERNLLESDNRMEKAERRATEAAEKVNRLMVNNHQMENTAREKDCLANQVRELQSRVSALQRQYSDALSLKDQKEEQYHVLSAQLKAKTVALQELNSEYITLKRRQVSRKDQGEALHSLKTRYNDIRSKYDTLLKRKSQTDFDAAPLKAKLSCLVLKCQQRNDLLSQMMKVMHGRGCVDSQLSQQVEDLLSDAALQDYTTAFTPGDNTKTRNNCTGFTKQLIATLQGCTLVSTSVHEQEEPKVLADSVERSLSSEKCSQDLVASKSTRNLSVVTPEGSSSSSSSSAAAAGTLQTNSAVPMSPVLQPDRVQLSPSGSETPKNLHQRSAKSPRSTQTPASPQSSTRISPHRGLSGPEKILILHEELQKTLMSSFQLSDTKGSEEPTRRPEDVSSSADLHPTNPITSTTLYNAVLSRSATLPPCRFSIATSPSKLTLPPSSATTITSPKNTEITTAVTKVSVPKPPETVENASTGNSNVVFEAPESNAAVLASDILKDGDVCVSTSLAQSSKHIQCIHGSLKRSNKPTRKFSDAVEMRKSARPKSSIAPSEVSCLEVINTVGQSSIMIGWDRPPLDELGCSNGTFVYGYRVFVDGIFHKSVLSSACTKCVLENVDLSLPVQISVQTLGLNGRTSNSVNTMYTHN